MSQYIIGIVFCYSISFKPTNPRAGASAGADGHRPETPRSGWWQTGAAAFHDHRHAVNLGFGFRAFPKGPKDPIVRYWGLG